MRDARRLVDDLQGTLQKKEEAMLAKVLQDVGGLIQKVGKEKGYALVLERQRSSILYASAEADLTDEVIRAFDDETRKPPRSDRVASRRGHGSDRARPHDPPRWERLSTRT